MKAMCIDEKKDFVWQDVPDPVWHGGFDVKLKVEACAVNRADLMQRAGIYAPPEGWPLWPGLECAGVVLEAPTNGRFKPGDRVCALLGGGGYAEQVWAPSAVYLSDWASRSFRLGAATGNAGVVSMIGGYDLWRISTGVLSTKEFLFAPPSGTVIFFK